MTVMYMYSPSTREYLGSRAATVINGKEIVKAAYAVTTAPPDPIPEGHAAVWNGSSWDIVEDHRRKTDEHGVFYGGTPYWLPEEGDDWESAARYMEDLGPLPDGAVTEQPVRVYTLEELRTEFLSKLNSDFDYFSSTLAVDTSTGYTVNADTEALMNVSCLLDAGTFPVSFMLYDNNTVSLNKEQLTTIKNEMFAARQELYQRKWTVRDAINNAKTTDELKSVSWDSSLTLKSARTR